MQFKNWQNKTGLVFIAAGILIFSAFASAQSTDELEKQIEDRNRKIEQLNKEIEVYEKEIEQTSKEAGTLKNTIKTIDTNQKKIGAQIQVTENSIQKTALTIEELAIEINRIEKAVGNNTEAVSKALRNLQKIDDTSMIELVLAYNDLGELWDSIASIKNFQDRVKVKTVELNSLNKELMSKLSASEKNKLELAGLKKDLSYQNTVLVNTKNEKNTLLKETQNKESEYKKVVEAKVAERERFEKELFEFESRLKIAIDPKSFPSAHSGILNWPLDSIFITQHFGKTVDAKRLYLSGTHNGVDFRASRGTPVKAALSGLVEAVGNTDEERGCYSYGKWILIKHENGLSTMYAHLDAIKISSGQNVSTGEVIGWSGQTGFSTGPHLHFTIYASQGVRVEKYVSSRNCKNVSIPIADIRAYLDPMLYLPRL